MNKIATLISILVLINSLISEEENKSLEGKYQLRPGFNIVITSDDDEYYVEPTGEPREKLTKVNELLFRIESIDGTIDFSLIISKKSDRVILNMYGQTVHAPRLPFDEIEYNPEEIEISDILLKYYTGIYELAAGTLIYVNYDDGDLMVQFTGQPEIEVYPFKENKFFYKVVDAMIEFVQNETGDVEYLLLYQNGIILQADKK